MFYLAFITFSYAFSFFTYIIFEKPIAQLWREFGPTNEKTYEPVYYHSQSAKSGKTKKKSKSSKNTTVDQSTSLIDGEGEHRGRRASIESEDLEDHKH